MEVVMVSKMGKKYRNRIALDRCEFKRIITVCTTPEILIRLYFQIGAISSEPSRIIKAFIYIYDIQIKYVELCTENSYTYVICRSNMYNSVQIKTICLIMYIYILSF